MMARRVRWKRWLLPLLAALPTAVVGIALLAPDWVVRVLARRNRDVVFFVETDARQVALTIADGPDRAATPRILDVLARFDARATFFVVTERIAGNESLLARMRAEGHEIANHLTQDRPCIRLSAEAFERELSMAHTALSRFTEPRWFRPGAGWFNERMLSALRERGYRCALDSVYPPFDAQIPSSWWAAQYITWQARAGSIVVLHDGGRRGLRTAAALERILPVWERRGLAAVTLSELVATGPG
jgi:peptidoglycan/xylan/chitin deacetylase (PgdA/CDA1 family)